MSSNLQANQPFDRAVGNLLKNDAPTKNYWPIAVAIGIIVSLAGVFLILAAHQILPHGINAISDLGIWGKVAGYFGLGAGGIIILIGAIKWHLKNKMQVLEKDNSVDASISTHQAQTTLQTSSVEKQSYCEYDMAPSMISVIKKSLNVLPPANYFFWAWGCARKEMTTECQTFLETHKTSDLPTVVVILVDSIVSLDGRRSEGFLKSYQESYQHLNCVEFSFTSNSFDPQSALNQNEMEKLNQIANVSR